MAASSSKMLQIAGKTDTTADPKNPKTEKKQKKQNNSRPFLHTDAFAHTCFYTEKQLTHTNLCTQYVFIHKRLLHREALFPLLDHQPFVFLFSSLTWYPFFMFLTTMFGVSWRRGACAVRHHGALQIANMKIPVWCMTRMQCLGKSWLHVFAPPDIIYIYFFFAHIHPWPLSPSFRSCILGSKIVAILMGTCSSEFGHSAQYGKNMGTIPFILFPSVLVVWFLNWNSGFASHGFWTRRWHRFDILVCDSMQFLAELSANKLRVATVCMFCSGFPVTPYQIICTSDLKTLNTIFAFDARAL